MVRLPLLLLTPGSFLTDGYQNYVWSADAILKGSLDFWYPPAYIALVSGIRGIFGLEAAAILYRIPSIVAFGLWFWAWDAVLRKLDISRAVANSVLLVSSFLAWPLVSSVVFHNDMFFAALAACLLYVLLLEKKSRAIWGLTAILVTLLLYTKPSAVFILAGAGIMILVNRNWKDIFAKSSAFVVGGILFIPWIIKNLNEFGTLYISASSEELARGSQFIGARFMSQLELVQSYLWYYPNRDQLAGFLGQEGIVVMLAASYYLVNVFVFAALTVLAFYGFLMLFKNRTEPYTKLFWFAGPVAFFSIFYWPWFGQYNFWDTGRYLIPVIPILVLFTLVAVSQLKSRILKLFIAVVLLAAMILSVVNVFAITYTYNQREQRVQELVSELKQENPDLEAVFTDITYTRITFNYYWGSLVAAEDTGKVNTFDQNCKEISLFKVCVDEAEAIAYITGPWGSR